jgi:hypothetical protein
LAHPRDTSRAIAQASLSFCIAFKGPRNEPSLENNGNFHKVDLKMPGVYFNLSDHSKPFPFLKSGYEIKASRMVCR